MSLPSHVGLEASEGPSGKHSPSVVTGGDVVFLAPRPRTGGPLGKLITRPVTRPSDKVIVF